MPYVSISTTCRDVTFEGSSLRRVAGYRRAIPAARLRLRFRYQWFLQVAAFDALG